MFDYNSKINTFTYMYSCTTFQLTPLINIIQSSQHCFQSQIVFFDLPFLFGPKALSALFLSASLSLD